MLMSMGQLPDLLAASEVADMFEVTDETIHRWARNGVLPYVTLPSGTKRFRRADIEALLPTAAATAARIDQS